MVSSIGTPSRLCIYIPAKSLINASTGVYTRDLLHPSLDIDMLVGLLYECLIKTHCVGIYGAKIAGIVGFSVLLVICQSCLHKLLSGFCSHTTKRYFDGTRITVQILLLGAGFILIRLDLSFASTYDERRFERLSKPFLYLLE